MLQEFGENPGNGGLVKRENLPLINNEVSLSIPESRAKKPLIRRVDQYM